MNLLALVIVILFGFISICSIYLLILACFGIRVRKLVQSSRLHKFTIVVPVHNEENQIGTLLSSLQQMDYPKSHLTFYFVADHCTDSSAELIRRWGGICLEKKDQCPGKGRALAWLTEYILKSSPEFDAFVFFDADNWVDKDFLKLINQRLNQGCDVIQGYTGIFNCDDSLFTYLNHISFSVINRFMENARSNLGFSCHLRGHGMCFRKNILMEINWDGSSLTEDLELLTRLVIAGKKVVWEHNAKVFSVIPSDITSSKKQRIRWAAGKNKILFTRFVPLLKSLIKNFNWVTLDLIIDLLMPSYSVLIGLSVLILVVSLYVLSELKFLILWSFGVVLALLLYIVFGAKAESIPLRNILRAAMVSPFFIFWRAWVQLLSFWNVNVNKWK